MEIVFDTAIYTKLILSILVFHQQVCKYITFYYYEK